MFHIILLSLISSTPNKVNGVTIKVYGSFNQKDSVSKQLKKTDECLINFKWEHRKWHLIMLTVNGRC